ncbi:MAG: hemerythrin domain-containing protein [Deltaproteobacteria bacterium]|nr:MAG: hemerythrin domain-containing protein [Deltaproteobacteria bacterium]
MSQLVQFFTEDHRACDVLWASVEAAADTGDAAATTSAWKAFFDAMERHFHMEEDELFPAFEEATGMRGGPTMMMRAEHKQMRALMGQMNTLVEAGDFGELVDQGDTLLMLIQQHNAKEEGMLYPMAQQHLAASWDALRARLPD